MYHFLYILSGMIIQSIILFVILKPSGTLRIDCSDEEKDIYRLELDDLDKLPKKRRIVLTIDNKADLSNSQK